MWEQFVLVLIVTTAIVFVPGYLGARLSGGKRALSLAVAGPLSVVFYIVAGIAMYPLGLKGLIPLFALAACFLALIAATRDGIEGLLHKKIQSSLALSLPGVCIVICLGALAASYVFYRGLGNPNNFLQYDDNYTHISYINRIIQTGVFSTFRASVYDGLPLSTPQPFSGSWYYPLAFHSFASIVTLLTHCSIGMAENAVNVVWTSLVYPLGLFALVSKIFGKKIQTAVLAPFAAFANMAFPIRMLTIHGPFPNMLSFCCVPIAVYLFVQLFDSITQSSSHKHGEKPQKASDIFMLISVLLGIVFCHPNGVFFWAILVFPYVLVSFIPRMVTNKCAGKKNKVAILVTLETLCIVLCIGLWVFILNSSLMKSVVNVIWGSDINPLYSIVHIANQSFIMKAPEVACAVFFWIGFIHTLIVKKSRWYTCSLLFVSIFFVVGLMGNLDIKRFLIGFWYTDPERIAAMMCITSTPLVLQGGVDIVSAVLVLLQKIKHAIKDTRFVESTHSYISRKKNFLIKDAIVVFLSIPVIYALWAPVDLLQFQERVPSRFRTSIYMMRDSYIPHGLKTYPSSEQKFIQRVREIVGDSVVLNNPFDGSSLAYAINGLNVYYKFKYTENETPESRLIRERLNRIFYEKEVRDAVRYVGAQYFVRLNMYPDDQFPTMPRVQEMWSGLNIDNLVPGFELVLEEGSYKLYRITAIDGE